MNPVGTITTVVVGLAAAAAFALINRYSQRRQADADRAWKIASAKLGLEYRRPFRTRSMEGQLEGFLVHVSAGPDPDEAPGHPLTNYVATIKGPVPRYTVVRTSSFMNPHDARLHTGDPIFDEKLAIIRPVRSHSDGYFTDERRRLILSVFDEYRAVTLNSSRLEVGTTGASVTAEELVEGTRRLVRIARALSIETNRRGIPTSGQ